MKQNLIIIALRPGANGLSQSLLLVLLIIAMIQGSCRKHEDFVPQSTTDEIHIDSIVPSKRVLVVWEESFITVYARGQELSFKWETDHGTLIGRDSVTVLYYACPSCIGHNTVKCTVFNESGSVSDTVMIRVN